MSSTSTFYNQVNLVSDNGAPGSRTNPNLVNGWGLAHTATGPWWVSSADKGLSIEYDGAGGQTEPDVIIPPAAGQTEGSPTGASGNDSAAFAISANGKSAPSLYVFTTEDGTIAGWNPAVDVTHAVKVVDNSASGAVYKGGAIAVRKHHALFYAADFHNGKVDAFDANFQPLSLPAGAFTDSHLPAGYAPFNVANVNGNLFVTYALQDAPAHDDVGGPRHGFVDVFTTAGSLVRRFASRGSLDSPWGIAVAPASFGLFSGDVLIGNFGNGKISAFNSKGRFQGFLTGSDGNPVEIPGLWGLGFGNGAQAGPTNTLYFAAGPDEESHGLFGTLTPGKHHHTITGGSTPGGGGFQY
jgi:uncharacterized protein (TIGR03118 family)